MAIAVDHRTLGLQRDWIPSHKNQYKFTVIANPEIP